MQFTKFTAEELDVINVIVNVTSWKQSQLLTHFGPIDPPALHPIYFIYGIVYRGWWPYPTSISKSSLKKYTARNHPCNTSPPSIKGLSVLMKWVQAKHICLDLAESLGSSQNLGIICSHLVTKVHLCPFQTLCCFHTSYDKIVQIDRFQRVYFIV